ncbi:hypothetical protein GCM10009840_23690 [Pseudolysinimonas kribbensis]|uniref:Uncharacterized protein n=1 Tax=Pseudolysinimonas kribbensis TaxID=433641 RepID=A0ABQ6K9E5_9MICO|nr:hypothetical protein [Pseudolysinimonas kribbensis]GMA96878.1 hypothetical protein GCM10025881_37020 [Pseudolysinimonas kribbensis]
MTLRPLARGLLIGLGLGLAAGALVTVALTVAVATSAGRSTTPYRAGFSDRGLSPACRVLDGSRIVVEFTIDPLDGHAGLLGVTSSGRAVPWRVIPLGDGIRPGEDPVEPLVVPDASTRRVEIEGPSTVLVAVALPGDEMLRSLTLTWTSGEPRSLQEVVIGARVLGGACSIAGVT